MPEANIVLTIPEPGVVELKEKPRPSIVPGYVLVKVAIAPLCIETKVYNEHMFEWSEDPDRLGHEGVGEIAEVAGNSRFQVGDRVIMYQGNPCGECYVCTNALSPTHCVRTPFDEIDEVADPHAPLEALGGRRAIDAIGRGLIEATNNSASGGWGFSRYRIVPEHAAQKIPDELSFRHAALANCALGCTYNASEELGVKAGDDVLVTGGTPVVGSGFFGYSAIATAKYRGATAIALFGDDQARDIARRLGADLVLSPDDPDWLKALRDFTGYRRGVNHVLECTGDPDYQAKCLEALCHYGSMHFQGFIPGSPERLPLHTLEDVMNKHITLMGGHDVAVRARQGLLDMLLDPDVQKAADILVTGEFNMSDGAAALEAAQSAAAGKVYLYPWEDAPQR